ncbi:MAG: DUF4157 domain-containing protein [Bacteroidetes bacterium]|nr:MAG: DUF4157 domain-containing protein [Bacteroidota bacterium]
MAARVMRMPLEQSAPMKPKKETPGIQLKCATCSETLQMKSRGTGEIDSTLQSRLNGSKGKGAPLSSSTHRQMSNSFGTDFSKVRIHTDSSAVQMNQQLNAKAFTNGSDIYFNKGEYNPYSPGGKELLAHELTHVVQQGNTENQIQKKSWTDWISETASDSAEWVAETASDALDTGAEFLMSTIEKYTPGLAKLIRIGPMGVINELLNSGIQNWINDKLCRFNLDGVISGFTGELGETFSMLKGISKSTAESCGAFAKSLLNIKQWIGRITNNPLVNGIQNGIQSIKKGVNKVLKFIATPVFDGLVSVGGSVFRIIKKYALKVAGWGKIIKDHAAPIWNKVKEKLGIISDGTDGVWELIKGKANLVWKKIQEKFGPIIQTLKSYAKSIAAISPIGPLLGIIKYGPQILESIQWLWANRDNPEIIKSAHKEMGHTILPKLLGGLKNAKSGFIKGIKTLKGNLLQIAKVLADTMSRFSEHPIFSPIRTCIEVVSNNFNRLINWVSNDATSLTKTINTWYQKWKRYIDPIIEVVTSLTLATAQPYLIPVLLTGWAWKLLPDCYKLPIIDFILDIVIGFLKKAPTLSFFGGLWAIVKEGIIGGLEKFRSLKTPKGQEDSQNPKVLLSNKFASILSGSNLGFMVGYAKGFIQGVWEGITDPFKIAVDLFRGLANLPAWLDRMRSKEPSGKTTQKRAKSNSTPSAKASVSEGNAPEPINVAEEMGALGKDISSDVTAVKENFYPAVQEAMNGEGDSITLDSILEMLGAMKEKAKNAMKTAGSKLANSFIEYMMKGDATMDLGKKIGWLSGTIIFEVVLAILTAGVANAASWGAKALKYILKVVDWMGEAMGVAFKYLGKLGKYLIQIARKIGSWLGKGKGAIGNVLRALTKIGKKILAFVQRILLGGGKKGAKEAAEAVTEKTGKEASEKAGREGLEETGEQGTLNEKVINQDKLIIRPKVKYKKKLEDGREFKIFDNGLIKICASPCTDVKTKYRYALEKRSDLAKKLEVIEALSKDHPSKAANDLIEIERELKLEEFKFIFGDRKVNKDWIASSGRNTTKEYRRMIKNANHSKHGYKHLKAKTADQALEMSIKEAQYLPKTHKGLKALEKKGLLEGRLVPRGEGGFWKLFKSDTPVGYDNKELTHWMRVEYSSGSVHSHPMSIDRVKKYFPDVQK